MAPSGISRFAILIAIVTISGPVFAAKNNYIDDHYFQILYDTSEPVNKKFRQDFGYAVYIHYDGKRILMDTGTNPAVLEHNLRTAGIDIKKLDLLVMTHNHHDHAGGMKRIMQLNPGLSVMIPPGQVFPVSSGKVVKDHIKIGKNIFIIRGHTKIPTAGIYDDLSIVLRTAKGPYVISSCSHSGTAQIIERASKILGMKVYYFSGGSRLVHRPASDAHSVAKAIKKQNIQVVSPSHCSLSHRVKRAFRQHLGQRVVGSQLGKKIRLKLYRQNSKPVN